MMGKEGNKSLFFSGLYVVISGVNQGLKLLITQALGTGSVWYNRHIYQRSNG